MLLGVQINKVIYRVEISKLAKKGIDKAPAQVAKKLTTWMFAVGEVGLEEIRKSPGYHDEPLHGKRKGQRSIRLNRGWRAIYEVRANHSVEFVSIEEVSNHDY